MSCAHARLWLASLGVLAACELSRPQDAYLPDARVYNSADNGFGGRDAQSVQPDDARDAGNTISESADAGGNMVIDDPANPLSVLQGKYLMRIDVYSTVSATSLGNTLTIRNRVSNLMHLGLSLKDDGTLSGHETLCTQSYYHECVSSCSMWKTEVDPELPKLCTSRVTDRDYKVDASGRLQVDPAVIAIGFNEADSSATLPVDQNDSRVWRMGSAGQNRFGVNTHLLAKLGPLDSTSLDCVVSTVQRYSSTFSGQLDLAKFGKDALVKKPMRADTEATTGATIYVSGVPDQYCNQDTLKTTGQQKPDQITVVRFQRYDGANCPVTEAAYEAAFPGVATRPSSGDLM